jgi:hypothetical protein
MSDCSLPKEIRGNQASLYAILDNTQLRGRFAVFHFRADTGGGCHCPPYSRHMRLCNRIHGLNPVELTWIEALNVGESSQCIEQGKWASGSVDK